MPVGSIIYAGRNSVDKEEWRTTGRKRLSKEEATRKKPFIPRQEASFQCANLKQKRSKYLIMSTLWQTRFEIDNGQLGKGSYHTSDPMEIRHTSFTFLLTDIEITYPVHLVS